MNDVLDISYLPNLHTFWTFCKSGRIKVIFPQNIIYRIWEKNNSFTKFKPETKLIFKDDSNKTMSVDLIDFGLNEGRVFDFNTGFDFKTINYNRSDATPFDVDSVWG